MPLLALFYSPTLLQVMPQTISYRRLTVTNSQLDAQPSTLMQWHVLIVL